MECTVGSEPGKVSLQPGKSSWLYKDQTPVKVQTGEPVIGVPSEM